MNDDKKIDLERMKIASAALNNILDAIGKYDKIYKGLSRQEKAAFGGLVFNIIGIWDDISLIGAIVERPLGAFLINDLVQWFNNPPKREGGSPIIPSGSGGQPSPLTN